MPPPTLLAGRGAALPALLVVGLALGTAGCGRRGALEPPPGAEPGPAPASARVSATPTTLATAPGAVVTDTPDDETEANGAVTVIPQPTPRRRVRAYTIPKEPFILDPLL